MTMAELSVVIPVRDEAENIPELSARLTRALEGLAGEWEVIFVTDINSDETVPRLRELVARDRRFKALKLSNRFGHHAAILAGLREAAGRAAVIMDGDLQDRPEDIAALHAEMRKGYDVVYGVKERKNETWFRNLCSRAFVRLIAALSDHRIEFTTSLFRIISRRTIDELLRFSERDPSITFIIGLINFPTSRVPVASGRRGRGTTKYPFARQLGFALDSLLSFSVKPLKLISVAGLVVAALSILYFAVVMVQKVTSGVPVLGWATLAALITLLGGVQLFCMGIIGEYLGRMFIQGKNRPPYIVEERIGLFS
ncbi:MAG: glycosyltransferase family 2 protein [bacterium]|nr:glycosyltransferase family 2 protein [bacterium]